MAERLRRCWNGFTLLAADAWQAMRRLFFRLTLRRRPGWPEWSRAEPVGLARYASREARLWVTLPTSRYARNRDAAARDLLVGQLYEALCRHEIHYDYELYSGPNPVSQAIRSPGEIFEDPHVGTCLDLALLFAGLCLAWNLLPVLIVLEGHVFVGVFRHADLLDGELRPEFDRFRPGLGLLEDPAVVRDWVANGRLTPVECTGFAALQLPDGKVAPAQPEFAGRDDGYLSFARAVEVGRTHLQEGTRDFRYAIDLAAAHYSFRIAPHPVPYYPHVRSWARLRRHWKWATLGLVALLAVGGVLGWIYVENQAATLRADTERKEHIRKLVDALCEPTTPVGKLRGLVEREPAEVLGAVRAELQGRATAGRVDYPAVQLTDALRAARQRTRLALALYVLEAPALLREVLSSAEDCQWPQARSDCIQQLAQAAGAAEPVLSLLTEARSPAETQGLLLALGNVPEASLQTPARLDQLVGFLRADDPGIHGAAAWLLRNKAGAAGRQRLTAEEAAFRKQGTDRLRGKPAGLRHWFVDPPTGLTFVYFPARQTLRMGNLLERLQRIEAAVPPYEPEPHEARIARAFAVATTEVSEQLFGKADGRAEVAMTNISWDEAAQFCARLSGPAERQCFMPSVQNPQRWTTVPRFWEKTGYRLPTEAEWELACRGGSSSTWTLGDDERMLDYYGRYRSEAATNAEAVGQLLPNRYGLFDGHGGVSEWCADPPRNFRRLNQGTYHDDDREPPEHRWGRIVRGGGFKTKDFRQTTSFYRRELIQTTSLSDLGFRLARTVEPASLGLADR